MTRERNRLRVNPSPPTAEFGFNAAPEMATAVDRVILPPMNCSVRRQPVALLPQYRG